MPPLRQIVRGLLALDGLERQPIQRPIGRQRQIGARHLRDETQLRAASRLVLCEELLIRRVRLTLYAAEQVDFP